MLQGRGNLRHIANTRLLSLSTRIFLNVYDPSVCSNALPK